MTEDEANQKVADFLTLMIQVTEHERKNGVVDDGKDACEICKSSICSMVQRNNALTCWRNYTKTPEKLLEDLSRKNDENNGRGEIIEID